MDEQRLPVARDPWAAVTIICIVGCVLLGAIVNGQGHVGFDRPFADAVWGLPVPEEAWRAITQAGGLLLVVMGAALVVALVSLGRLRLAVVVALALIASALVTDAVKLVVARPRPPDPVFPVDGYSFPSGHTLQGTVTYGIAALLAWRSSWSLRLRRSAAAGLVGLIVAIGLSRVALGVHYPSDVVAGWLAGTAIVSIVALADTADRARPSPRRLSRSGRRR